MSDSDEPDDSETELLPEGHPMRRKFEDDGSGLVVAMRRGCETCPD